jgi:hypothetical protein
MKKILVLSPVIIVCLLYAACNKTPQNAPNTTMKSNPEQIPTVPPCVLNNNCPPPVPPPTDDQLYATGQNLGCTLAKSNNGASSTQIVGYTSNGQPIIGYTAIYQVFQNTVNNPSFPAAYKNGVSEGWIQCFSSGPLVGGNSCPTISVWVTSGSSGPHFSDVNYCTYISSAPIH